MTSICAIFAYNDSNQSNIGNFSDFEIEDNFNFSDNFSNLEFNETFGENISNENITPKLFKKSDKDYQIKLNGEKVNYDELDIDKFSKKTKKLKNSSNTKTHYLVQFYNKLTRTEVDNLKDEGINVLNYIGNNAYYVSFKNTKLLTESDENKFSNINSSLEIDNYLSDNNALRTIEEVDEDFKLSKNLKEGNLGNWSYDDEGNIYLNVQFYKDVTLDDAEKLMNEKGFEVISRLESINALTIKIDGVRKVNKKSVWYYWNFFGVNFSFRLY